MNQIFKSLVAWLEKAADYEHRLITELQLIKYENKFEKRAVPLYRPEGFPALARIRRTPVRIREIIVNRILLRHCPDACQWLERLISLPIATESELLEYALTAPMGLRYVVRAYHNHSFLIYVRNFRLENTVEDLAVGYDSIRHFLILYEWEKKGSTYAHAIFGAHPAIVYQYLRTYFEIMLKLKPNGKLKWVGCHFPPIFDKTDLPPRDPELAMRCRSKRIYLLFRL